VFASEESFLCVRARDTREAGYARMAGRLSTMNDTLLE
jgi:hypothetical protein